MESEPSTLCAHSYNNTPGDLRSPPYPKACSSGRFHGATRRGRRRERQRQGERQRQRECECERGNGDEEEVVPTQEAEEGGGNEVEASGPRVPVEGDARQHKSVLLRRNPVQDPLCRRGRRPCLHSVLLLPLLRLPYLTNRTLILSVHRDSTLSLGQVVRFFCSTA